MKILLLLLAPLAWGQVEGIPRRFDEVYHSPGAGQKTFPTGVAAGYTVTVIDGNSASPCTTGGGSTKSQCRYSGSAWQPVGPASAGGGDAQTASPLSQFAPTTSSQLRGVISDETGTGAAVFGTSPTIDGLVGTGAVNLGGASGLLLRFGTTAPSSADCDSAGERGSVYVQSGDPASVATRVSVCTQTGASSYAWMPISHKVGTTAPATCVTGEVFFDSDATAGLNWFGCTASNVWNPLGGSLALQSGQAQRCASATVSDAYTCTMLPTLTAYTTGQVVNFVATAFANVGAATLEIDGICCSGKAIKLCDGSTDPATGVIAIGRQVPLTYDGTVFRLPCNSAPIDTGAISAPFAPFGIPDISSAASATTPTISGANKVNYAAFWVPYPGISFSKLSGKPVTGAGKISFGINDSTCVRLAYTDTLVAPGANVVTWAFPSTVTLTPGQYFLSFNSDTAGDRMTGAVGSGGYTGQLLNHGVSANSEFVFEGLNTSVTASNITTPPSSCGATRTAQSTAGGSGASAVVFKP